jgi:hypothetical protein
MVGERAKSCTVLHIEKILIVLIVWLYRTLAGGVLVAKPLWTCCSPLSLNIHQELLSF